MKAADFCFFLPTELIAAKPVQERDSSRLLVLNRNGEAEHRLFSDLPEYLSEGDMLLVNNTKVFPARLTGIKRNGGSLEILLVRGNGNNEWEILSKGSYTGTLRISDELEAEILNGRLARFRHSGDFMNIVWKYGDMPLPPYIKRRPDESDKGRYQTVYAAAEGSIAAPTAGLHFTERLISRIAEKGVKVRELTLHIGTGTFKPIKTEDIEMHQMDSECFSINSGLVDEIANLRKTGKRLVAVGTTATRAIEGFLSGRFHAPLTQGTGKTISQSENRLPENSDGTMIRGRTDIFIYPGYEFRAVNSLVTNFHLPGSTPLMLTAALCGWEQLKSAYADAISRRYRFFSYGDAMLVL
jgi:S-adenosylmethionine:tRNA ribosyltransferase-isomerase